MRFSSKLQGGTLLRRYKRFLADVRLDDGRVVTASCPNTGSMLGLCEPGSRVWLLHAPAATRKYAHAWQLTEQDLGRGPRLVGINTGLPNALVEAAIRDGTIVELGGFPSLRREVNYGLNSRIDLLLETPTGRRCYVEVKNVHLSRKAGLAEFPDCVSERAVKHLRELTSMVESGHRATMIYLVQRSDTQAFRLAADLDPTYAKAFALARAAGVEALAYACHISTEAVEVSHRLSFEA